MFLIDDLANYWINRDALERAQEKTEQRENELNNIKTSRLSMGDDYKFNPGLYDRPKDIDFKQIELDPALRERQLAALDNMQSLANSHAGKQSDYERQRAIMEANNNAKNQQASIQQNAAARGQGGSLMEYLLRNQSGQESSNRAGQLGLQSASNAALERLQANGLLQQ